MFRIMVVLFTIIPALEIYLLFKFASHFGGFNTILIVIATGLAGAALAKREGLYVLNSINQNLSLNQLPANDMIGALFVFGGGLLLLTPGFITDIIGLSMIFPISRLFYISIFKELFTRGILKGNIQFYNMSANSHHNSKNKQDNYENVIEADFSKRQQ